MLREVEDLHKVVEEARRKEVTESWCGAQSWK
jgi:hypothetical protein